MRANEFITEGPLEPIPQEKRQFYRDIWRHQFAAPGELWDDNYDDRPAGLRDPFTSGAGIKHLGSGAEAAVIKSSNENGVYKVIGTYQQLGQSGHLQYLLATKKYANSNPYFPRILGANAINRISGTDPDVHGYIVKTERLYNLSTMSTDALTAMLQKIYGTNFVSHFDDMVQFARYIKSGINGALASQVIDPEFKQAAKLIIAVATKINSQHAINDLIDLHAANMMVRLTHVGPQLVLSDPIYNGDEGQYNN